MTERHAKAASSGVATENEEADVDRLLQAYRDAVEVWIAAIRREEALASSTHSLKGIDRWESGHFEEEMARDKAKTAKQDLESALRQKFFGFS